MTAPERIWAGEGEYWHKPHIANPTAEYILHTRAALAASPLVQDMIRQAVEAEREACAGLADDSAAWYAEGAANAVNQSQRYIDERMKSASDAIAAAIRARKGE